MVRTLEQAVAEVAELSPADQEEIGRTLLSHVRKLRQLRRALEEDLGSIDAGEGRSLEIEKFIWQASGH